MQEIALAACLPNQNAVNANGPGVATYPQLMNACSRSIALSQPKSSRTRIRVAAFAYNAGYRPQRMQSSNCKRLSCRGGFQHLQILHRFLMTRIQFQNYLQ
jgi:hypothetical protein